MADLEFHDDPQAFLEEASDHLAAHPVVSTVVTSVTYRAAAGDPYRGDGPRWWVVAREGDEVVGVAMRTAPGAPHPLYVLPMPNAAATALARALHARGEEVCAVNGADPGARVVAEEIARLTGRRAAVEQQERLHLLGDLTPPLGVPGRLRGATRDDVEVCLAWYAAFEVDAAAQAGRSTSHGPLEPQDAASMTIRLDQHRVWLWEDPDGRVVHLTAANAPAFGVARIGPVYTPSEQRGRGYASAAVAEVSRRLLALDARVCLFTDPANPTSNRIYSALGFRPVADMVDLVLA